MRRLWELCWGAGRILLVFWRFSGPGPRLILSLQRNAAPVVSTIRTYAADAKASPTEVSSILEQRIRGVQDEANLAETGRVLSVGYVVPRLGAGSWQLGRWLVSGERALHRNQQGPMAESDATGCPIGMRKLTLFTSQ